MTENKLISLDTGEKCWLIIGVCLGIMLTFICLYCYTYLPRLSEIQRVGLICFVFGGALGFLITKFQWEELQE